MRRAEARLVESPEAMMESVCPLAFLARNCGEGRYGSGRQGCRPVSSMGFCPDVRVKVVSADRGSVIVSVGGARYALSRSGYEGHGEGHRGVCMKREIKLRSSATRTSANNDLNLLTGSRRHVGNWPGVTVEKKTGRLSRNG